MGKVSKSLEIKYMQNGNVIIIVLVGSLAIADLKVGQHGDHIPETTHEVQSSFVVPYAWNGIITGSVHQ